MLDQLVNVAIIGCGRIGTQWDSPEMDLPHALTHAAAVRRNPSCRLIAVCDLDQERATAAAMRWSCPAAYSNPSEMLAVERVDLLVVATSSTARWSIIEPALASGIKFFVIEKPLAETLGESNLIASELRRFKAQGIVNFSRHWDPAMRELRSRIAGGEFGALQRTIGLYGKGIANNGSHMIDLVSTLCSTTPRLARSLGRSLNPSESSWSKDCETTLDAQIRFVDKNDSVVQLDLLGTDQRAFTCFELELIGSRAMYGIKAGGRSHIHSRIISDPDFPGYKIPGRSICSPGRALESVQAMMDEAIAWVRGDLSRVSCDVESALNTAKAVDAVRRSQDEGGRWVSTDGS